MEFMDFDKKIKPKRKNTSNRVGASFEVQLRDVFHEYRLCQDAMIVKIPTEATVIRNFGKIVNVVYKEKSDSLDFQGILKDGTFITFEAKTYKAYDPKRKTPNPFPLDNISDYQYDLFDELAVFTDKIFYIIQARFEDYNEHYIIHANNIKKYKESSGKRSIPYAKLSELGMKIPDLDILKYLNEI